MIQRTHKNLARSRSHASVGRYTSNGKIKIASVNAAEIRHAGHPVSTRPRRRPVAPWVVIGIRVTNRKPRCPLQPGSIISPTAVPSPKAVEIGPSTIEKLPAFFEIQVGGLEGDAIQNRNLFAYSNKRNIPSPRTGEDNASVPGSQGRGIPDHQENRDALVGGCVECLRCGPVGFFPIGDESLKIRVEPDFQRNHRSRRSRRNHQRPHGRIHRHTASHVCGNRNNQRSHGRINHGVLPHIGSGGNHQRSLTDPLAHISTRGNCILNDVARCPVNLLECRFELGGHGENAVKLPRPRAPP